MANQPSKATRKPAALRPGDTVAVIAPASNIQRELLRDGCDALRNLGYRPICQESIFEKDLYFAGSVHRRAAELEEMFLRDDVRALICARGGYGSNYLLQAINVDKLIAHPKIFVGYSDITTLLTYFLDSMGLVTFHGPMVAKDFANQGGVDLASWDAALAGGTRWAVSTSQGSGARGLVDGEGEGVLYGGCLSMLVATLGTPYEIETDDRILFLEDVAAKPFQIDRMLMHLKLAGKLSRLRGIVFGEMLDCVQGPTQDYTLEEVVRRVVGDIGIPVAFGLRSGHVTGGNITLPIGVRATLEVNGRDVEMRALEAAVQ